MRTLILLAYFATCLSAQITFQPATTLPFGSQPDGIAAADFDLDGDQDLAVALDAPDRVAIYVNSGAGMFSLGNTILVGAGTSPQAVQARDMNADGFPDIVVSLKNTNQVRVYQNNLGTSFTLLSTSTTGSEPRHLAVGDLNLDGAPDVVTSNRNGDTLSVFTNNGLGMLSATATLSGLSEPRFVAIGDLDLDGDGDIAVASHDDRTLRVFINNGGTFTPLAPLFVGALVRPEGMAIADMNGDGANDLVTSVSDQTFNIHQVAIFLNAGGTTFTGPTNANVGGTEPGALVAVDLDGDGDPDVATANKISNNVSVLANTAGVLGAPTLLAAGTEPDGLAAADLDGNGSLDLVTANKTSNNGSIFLNQGGGIVVPPMPGLTQLTPPTIGTMAQMLLSSPGDAGRTYQFAAAFGATPGIALGDGRTLPLNPDALFLLTIQPFNGLLQNPIGSLNGAAQATVGLNIPNIPAIVGGTIFGAFIVYEPAASVGVATVSPSLAITFQ